MKYIGKPSAGNRHAGFDVAGAGNVTMGVGLRPRGESPGYSTVPYRQRASSRPDQLPNSEIFECRLGKLKKIETFEPSLDGKNRDTESIAQVEKHARYLTHGGPAHIQRAFSHCAGRRQRNSLGSTSTTMKNITVSIVAGPLRFERHQFLLVQIDDEVTKPALGSR